MCRCLFTDIDSNLLACSIPWISFRDNSNSTLASGDATVMQPTVSSNQLTNESARTVVGDGAVGNSSLLISCTTTDCLSEHVPTEFGNYAVTVM
jgi:hypothetical protein